jgi:hypothetical protein
VGEQQSNRVKLISHNYDVRGSYIVDTLLLKLFISESIHVKNKEKREERKKRKREKREKERKREEKERREREKERKEKENLG